MSSNKKVNKNNKENIDKKKYILSIDLFNELIKNIFL